MLLNSLSIKTFQPFNFSDKISLWYCMENTALLLYCQGKYGVRDYISKGIFHNMTLHGV